MQAIQDLHDSVAAVLQNVDKITSEINAEIRDKAPRLIHQRFCSELVNLAKEHHGKVPAEVQEMLDVLAALRLLEKCYPQLLRKDAEINKS